MTIEGLSRAMTGEGCSAEPMTRRHRELLRAAFAEDLDIWQLWVLDFRPENFDASFDRVMELGWFAFLLYDGDELAGTSAFINPDPNRGVVEIGHTYYRPRFRGTGFNRRAKTMMLKCAFDCGMRRVEFRVDARNTRSQAAMTKLGAVREGVLRADRITWTGHIRDTVLFSILKDEWPG